jgi:DNA (cytosine-5)-methyltransferase 1
LFVVILVRETMERDEIIVDSFAGGGGASLGIAWATGHAPDIAINHDRQAIEMHAANHPDTVHVLEDVWKADLRKLTDGKPVSLLWASPDCKHFSRAKGGKPVEKRIRSLAWIVCKWAKEVQPRVIALENVREFADWGPLVPRLVCRECGWKGTEGQAKLLRVRRRCPDCDSLKMTETEDLVPDPSRKGLTFRRFVGRLKTLGYVVEWRNMDAADYGAPTHRRRLFLVARRDGHPIRWPQPTHGNGLRPYRTAADCIDWSIECPSIFGRKRPLAEKTMRRIALGIQRYVLNAANPFIVQLAHGESGRWGSGSNAIDLPLGTIHAGGGNHAIVDPVLLKADSEIGTPFIAQTSHTGTTGRGAYVWGTDEPVRTISQRGEFSVVTPVLSKFHGSKSSGDSRCKQLELPFNTLDTQPRFALLTPHLVTVGHGERPGQDARANSIEKPIGTVTSKGHHALVSAFLAKHFGGMVGVEVETPLPTTTTKGCQTQLVAANLIHMNHGGKQWSELSEPMRTVMSGGTHAALVYSFLTRFFGNSIGQPVDEPAPTANGCNKTGLVTVVIDGELYVIVDIGMRMLTPRELARAQGFPDTYCLTGTKTSQVARIGNSVCPPIAEAIVRANCLSEVLEETAR